MTSFSELQKDKGQVDFDWELAELVHRSMIPVDGRQGLLDVACSFQPMQGVGGDYASVFFQNYSKAVVSICDVTGHGLAAALLANRVNSFVLGQAPTIEHPCQMGERLNEFFYEHFGKTHLLVSFFCLYLDLKSQSLTYAGFGHPPVFLISKNKGTIESLNSVNTLIGISANLVQHCSMLTVPFEIGDRLILYTDGISESENEKGEQLEMEQLRQIVQRQAHLSPKVHVAAIKESLSVFRQGNVPQDDQLLMAVSFAGNKGWAQ